MVVSAVWRDYPNLECLAPVSHFIVVEASYFAYDREYEYCLWNMTRTVTWSMFSSVPGFVRILFEYYAGAYVKLVFWLKSGLIFLSRQTWPTRYNLICTCCHLLTSSLLQNKGMRFVKNVGLGFKTPKLAKEGNYVDKKCPFTGNVSIRGRILKVIFQLGMIMGGVNINELEVQEQAFMNAARLYTQAWFWI